MQAERHLGAAGAFRNRFEDGDLRVITPRLLYLEILNVAARKWLWTEERLTELALMLPELQFGVIEPALDLPAKWASTGLTAHDACFVAVADQAGVPLIADDAEQSRLAPGVAVPLSG